MKRSAKSRRPELEPWLWTVECRVVRPGIWSGHWKMNFRQAVDVYSSGLRPLCATLNDLTRHRVGSKAAAAAESAARMRNGVSGATGAATETIHGSEAPDARFGPETIAAAILRLSNDALSALRYQIRGPVTKSTGTKSGRTLAGGVTVDELLDAFADAPRHGALWRLRPKRSKKTIKTLARFYAGRKLGFKESLALLRTEDEPALKILAAIAPGSAVAPAVDCEALIASLLHAGNAIIDEHWAQWAHRTKLERALKRGEIAANPDEPAEAGTES